MFKKPFPLNRIILVASVSFSCLGESDRLVELTRLRSMGRAYYEEKKYAEAVKQFEKMRELDPTCPDTAYNLAVVYESLNELEKAFGELTRAVEWMPDEIGPHCRRMLIAARLWKMDVAAEERKVLAELWALGSRTRTPEELEMSLHPPELSDRLDRDFILRLDGWIKDGNPNTYTGDTVEPLPYRAMKNYPPLA